MPTTLTIEQVAEACHVSTKTVRRAIDAGELRASQLAYRGCWVIRPADVDAWLDLRANRPARERPAAPAEARATRAARRRGRGAQHEGRLVITDDMGRAA